MFNETVLGEVLDFYNGKAIKPGGEGKYPAYGSNGIIGGCDDHRYENGIIIGRVGAYCGSVAYCKGKFWASDNTIVAKPKHKEGSTRFFAYMLLAMNLNRHAGGAAQPLVTQSTLKAVPATVPDPATQRRIASILSAYDDLIENNTRRIAILEEMARRIYEEWFVRFRFPGREGVRMVESELGLVPAGWSAAILGDVAAYINRGLAPNYDDAAACIVINQKCIRDQRLNLGEARKQGKPVPAEKIVRLGDVLINSTGVGTLGRVAQVLEAIGNCTVDTHVSIVRPGKDCDTDFFGLRQR
jgi:type I restriction enzyme, S subunit